MKASPVWAEVSRARFPSLDEDLTVDALVVGGGIAGVTAAYLLAKKGVRVALLEKQRLCGGETGHTTAHISYPTDERLTDLVDRFGENHAQAIWDACLASALQISDNVTAEGIDCDLQHVPGFLYASGHDTSRESQRLRDETVLAQKLGFDVFYTDSCPVTGQPAMGFSTMLKFHPVKYVTALAETAVSLGAKIFENSAADEFSEDGKSLLCNGRRVHYEKVFIATHVPLQATAGTLSAALLQTKLAGYNTYAVGARLPQQVRPGQALWWDTSDPYFYLRIDHDQDGAFAIAGGEDHKTGESSDTEAHYSALIAKLHTLFPEAKVTYRWSGQVIEPVDGIPYIGELGHHFLGTGFSGTGMTMGTLSGMMFADHVLGNRNPWQDLFRVDRKKFSSTWDYLAENKDYPYYLLKRPFIGSKSEPEQLLAGEARVTRQDHQKVAAYRDEKGNLTLLSAICPHMGCVVAWNSAEKTWDCPCHGSRFTSTGDVVAGPAETGLKKLG